MKREIFSGEGQPLTVYESENAIMAIIPPPTSGHPKDAQGEFIAELINGFPYWERQEDDPNMIGRKGGGSSLTCTVHRHNHQWGFVLSHPKNMSVTKALIALEDEERGVFNPSLAAACIQADRGLTLYRNGKVPLLAPSFSSLAAALTLDGLITSLNAEDAIDIGPKDVLPPPISDIELERMIRDIPHQVFSTVYVPGEKDDVVSMRENLIPRGVETRMTNLARWALAFSRYLWSDDWWDSPKMHAFARTRATYMSAVITISAKTEAFLHPLPMNYRGVRFVPGSSPFSAIQHSKDINGTLSDWFLSVEKVWPQIIEWYAGEMKPEELRAFLPNGYYKTHPLGVDVRFELEDDLIAMRDVAKALLEEAEANAFYVPYGYFTLHLPDDLCERIRRIRLEHRPGFYYPGDDLTNLAALDISANPDGLWVRLSNGYGSGPIVRWWPGRLLMDNMISESFSALLDAVLSAVWSDLRVAGERAITSRSPRSSPKRDGEKRGQSKGERKSPPTPSARRSIRPIMLPRRQPEEHLYLKGRYDWSSVEERQRIKIGIRGIPGRHRRLPPGWKASQEALQRASEAGVIVPAGHTFVRPYTRGIYIDAEDSGEKAQTQNEPAVPIVSKGLATLVAFIGEPDEQEQNDAP